MDIYRNNLDDYDISIFTFINEPDHYRWQVQMGYWSVYVAVKYDEPPNDTPMVVQIIDTTLYYTWDPDNSVYRIRITRLLDTTLVGGTRYATTISNDTLAVLRFVIDSMINPGDPPVWQTRITDTVVKRVSSDFADSARTVFWGPEYMAEVICPIVDDARDDTLPDVKVIGPSVALAAHNSQNIGVKYLILSEISPDNYPMSKKTK